MIIVHGLAFILIISLGESLKLLEETKGISESQDSNLRDLMNIILTAHRNGRRLHAKSLAKAKGIYRKITKNMSKSQVKRWLRHEATATAPAETPDQVLVETELTKTADQGKSALHDRPFVEKIGRNDFLVMHPEVTDPFVTVIPNDIYNNFEKTCVNWLDDCSMKGIRMRLLRGVQSP